jgi:hypothetical protein
MEKPLRAKNTRTTAIRPTFLVQFCQLPQHRDSFLDALGKPEGRYPPNLIEGAMAAPDIFSGFGRQSRVKVGGVSSELAEINIMRRPFRDFNASKRICHGIDRGTPCYPSQEQLIPVSALQECSEGFRGSLGVVGKT